MSSSVFDMTPVRFLLAALVVGAGVLRADDPPVVPPNKGGGELDLTQFPGQVVDEVIVPVPSWFALVPKFKALVVLVVVVPERAVTPVEEELHP